LRGFSLAGAIACSRKLKAVGEQMIAARNAVYKVVEDHNAYRNEMDTAVRGGPASVELAATAINFLVDNINALSGVPEAQQFRGCAWLTECRSREYYLTFMQRSTLVYTTLVYTHRWLHAQVAKLVETSVLPK
jgi:hypothetical protein